MNVRAGLCVALAVIGLIGMSSSAFAHAQLKKSAPAANASVKVAPQEVTLWFSEALEPNFCEVEVLDSAGNRVDEGRATADAGDRKVLHVALKPLAPGAYKASWRAVSVDTHITKGDFSFKVAP
jgi:hypothetical protein